MSAKCELCHKKIEYRIKECDESGLAWHTNCFRCYVCRVPLNEKGVNIRGDDNSLYCGSHVIFQEGYQVLGEIRVPGAHQLQRDPTIERISIATATARPFALSTAFFPRMPNYKNVPVPVWHREGFWRTHDAEMDRVYWWKLLEQELTVEKGENLRDVIIEIK